jgi:hypothetical protein
LSVRSPVSNYRLGPELRRRIGELARLRNVSKSEIVRDLLLKALDNTDPRLDQIEENLRLLGQALELLAPNSRASESAEAARTAVLLQLLERLVVQQTEVLMMLRVVTFKDRPDDYDLAMRKTQETLAAFSNGAARDLKAAGRTGVQQ